MDNQLVAQIVFAPGTDESEVFEALRLVGQTAAVESTSVKTFDPKFGGPVIYFP